MSTIVVFRYDQFGIGGIQTWIYTAIKQLIRDKTTILLLTNRRRHIYDGFMAVFNSEFVSLLDYSEEYEWDYNQFSLVKYYTFTLEGYARACQIKQKYRTLSFDLFYCVPNFKGLDYYYDSPFNGVVKNYINKRLSRIFGNLNTANQIRYFSISHIETMTKLYNYSILSDSADLLVPQVDSASLPFDSEVRRNVWGRDEFRIITVSRFDFPHKAYIIGLIDAYEIIRKQNPRVSLWIVGYGHSLNEINNRISKLSLDAQSGITMIGETSYDDLPRLFEDSNLNISVAGCCLLGAKCGVLSIPARHYSYTCEVYGFIPDSMKMITSSEPGQPVLPFIEKTIAMSENEYIEKCLAGYNASNKETVNSSLLDSNAYNYVLSRADIGFILLLHKFILKYVPFKNRLQRAFRGEIVRMIRKKVENHSC